MCSKSSLKRVLLGSLLVLAACTTHHEDEARPADPITEAAQNGSLNVNLEDVTSSKCLNLEKYYEKIRSMPAQTKVRKVSTDVRFLSGNNLTKNYYLSLAGGSFEITDAELKDVQDFSEFKQSDCQSITFAAPGHNQTYKILTSKKGSVTYADDWGGQTVVTWTSPTSLTLEVTSNLTRIGDSLCDPNTAGKKTVTYQVNWGDSSIFTETLNEKMISQNFLALFAESKGASLNSLYTSPVSVEPSPVTVPPPPAPPADNSGAGNGDNHPIPGGDPGSTTNPGDNTGGSEVQPHPIVWNAERETNDYEPEASDRKILVSKLKEMMKLDERADLRQCY